MSSDSTPRETEVVGPARTVLARWCYPYLLVAAATFLIGAILGGAAMATTSPAALSEASGAFGNPQMFPDRLTTWTIFTNNVLALGIIATGVVTFALTTLLGLILNGVLLGAILVASAAEGSLAVTLALILPHGVIEYGAFFLASTVAYRVTWRLVSYLRGVQERPLTRAELLEAVSLLGVSVIVLAVAAWVEATLTVDVAEALLDRELDVA